MNRIQITGATIGTNELIPMTRRYPKLPHKVLYRDSKIAKRIIEAWDSEHDPEKVLSIFLKEHKNLSDERYWELMRSVWIVTGNIKHAGIFRKLMQANRRNKYYFSTPEEAEKLRNLPESIEVYRATNDKNDDGLSWTISKDYANRYAREFNKKLIITKTVNKSDVFAFINRNKEEEIILL